MNKTWKICEIFNAGKKGYGLRSIEVIEADNFIIEYVGVMSIEKDSKFQINSITEYTEIDYLLIADKEKKIISMLKDMVELPNI